MTDRDIPILISNAVTGDHGTGIECIAPAHDLESLKVAYHYGLPKEGYVDENGKFTEEMGPIFAGLSVFDEDTNKLMANMMDEEERLLIQYHYKNEFYQTTKNEERVILRSSKNWFLQISEALKMRCLEELSTTKFVPKLNLKDTEETHEDYKKLKSKSAKKEVEAYYLNIVEELTDFNDWCISDSNAWGIPIPFFTYKDTGKILLDQEIIEHFAELVENHGTSDIWHTFGTHDLLPHRYKDEADRLQKGYQVFDSWFDSALSWNFVLNEGQGNKALQEMEAKVLSSLALGRQRAAAGEMLEEGRGRGGRRVARQPAARPQQQKIRAEDDRILQI